MHSEATNTGMRLDADLLCFNILLQIVQPCADAVEGLRRHIQTCMHACHHTCTSLMFKGIHTLDCHSAQVSLGFACSHTRCELVRSNRVLSCMKQGALDVLQLTSSVGMQSSRTATSYSNSSCHHPSIHWMSRFNHISMRQTYGVTMQCHHPCHLQHT